MRPEERDPAYLWDMHEAARAILEYVDDQNSDEFLSHDKEQRILRLAVERQLEILGEAARRVSASFQAEHPEIPWREIVGLRNLISHEYNRIDYAAIYRIVRKNIPELLPVLGRLVPPPPPEE